MSKLGDKKASIGESNPDNYIITTCITLLGAYAFMFFSGKPNQPLVAYTAIASLFCLICALLTLVWYKFRFASRDRKFETLRETAINEYSSKIASYIENLALPYAEMKLKGKLQESVDVDLKRESKNIATEINKINENVFENFLIGLSKKIQDQYDIAYNKPLSESFGRIKLVIDKVSQSTRYYWFVIGLILFFISIITNLDSQ